MKKTIISALLILGIFTGFALSQTKKPTRVVKKTTKSKTTTRKSNRVTTTTKRKTIMETSKSAAAVTTDSGLTYIITEHGTGAQLKAGDTVVINYTGLLTNGAKFDSSLDRNEPLKFPLGAGRVIKGWDEGIQKLMSAIKRP